MRCYLRVGTKVLAVSGPSKSGKSVLIRRLLADTQTKYIPLTGASLDSMDAFWVKLAHRTSVAQSLEHGREQSTEISVQVGSRIGSGAVPASLSSQATGEVSPKSTRRRVNSILLSESVRDALQRERIRVALDDFLFAAEEIRIALVCEIKDMTFVGLRFILIAAPEHVMDVLQSEQELTGRVTRLRVVACNDLELLRIATLGFDALRVSDPGSPATRKYERKRRNVLGRIADEQSEQPRASSGYEPTCSTPLPFGARAWPVDDCSALSECPQRMQPLSTQRLFAYDLLHPSFSNRQRIVSE